MDLESAYQRTAAGWMRPLARPEALQYTKACPQCRVPITKIRRYGRVIKRSVLDNMTRKYVVKCCRMVREIREKLRGVESKLAEVARDVRHGVSLYASLTDKVDKLLQEIKLVQETPQPLARIRGELVREYVCLNMSMYVYMILHAYLAETAW